MTTPGLRLEIRRGAPSAPSLLVDGADPRATRSLSHWPGGGAPGRYRAETTTEMALLLAADERRAEFLRGIDVVANNHLDLDGLLSTWAVLCPAAALAHRPELVAAARAGDFEEWTTAPAVRMELAFQECEERSLSPAGEDLSGWAEEDREAAFYSDFHALLPDLLQEDRPLHPLGAERWAGMGESIRAVRAGALAVREEPLLALTVHETDRDLARRVRWAYAAHPRVLTFRRTPGGTFAEFEFQQWTWFETPREGRRYRRDLSPLAARLGEEERGGGIWTFEGMDILAPRLRCVGPDGEEAPTSIPPARLEVLLVETLESSGQGPCAAGDRDPGLPPRAAPPP